MPPRPRFAHELEPVAMSLPPGKQLGITLSISRAPNGDLLVLQHFGGPIDAPPDAARLPDVVRLTADGVFIDAWGGPDHIPAVDGVSQWPEGQEGIECDADGDIWIFGYLRGDNAVLKFSPDGELLLRIGQRDQRTRDEFDDDDTRSLNGPTSCFHDTETREVFISDGYGNHRVIAFNSDTGEFTRMWGAYGKQPSSLSADEGFGSPVHKVLRAPNGLMYVCDRRKNRIQEFELVPGGARFLREVFVAPGTALYGAAWDIAFTPDGKYMFVCDGTNLRVWTVDVESFSVLGWASAFPDPEGEGNMPLHHAPVHRFAMEPNGDLLLACTTRGLQRLRYLGVS